MPNHLRHRRRFAVAVAVVLVATGCNNADAEPSPDAFCETARQNPELITNPPLDTPDQIDQSIEFYRLMGQLAPLEIAPEWNQLVAAMETANDLVPDNPDSEQLVAQTAFASELAAVKVKDWMAERCGIELPITTIVSHSVPPDQLPVDQPTGDQSPAEATPTTPTTTGQTTPATAPATTPNTSPDTTASTG